MKIVLVSTYPPVQCGIGKYTKYLATEVNKISNYEVIVISEGGSDPNTPFPVFDTYSGKTDFHADIIRKIQEIRPDIVHFQHALVLFPDTGKFLKLVVETSKIVKKVCVTPHTADIGRNLKIDWEVFYRTILSAGHMIVHNEMCMNSIKHYGIPTEQVHVIPHGTKILQLPGKLTARQKLNIHEDEFIFLILGFIHLYKNHHSVIAAFRMMSRKKNVRLLIAGNADRNKWYNKLYLLACRILSAFSSKITWHGHFIDDETLPDYLAASDILLLPYWQNYPSASGIFHLGIGAKLPVLCSDSIKFSEVKSFFRNDSEFFIPTNNIFQWKKAMNSVMENPEKLNYVKDTFFKYAQETSWKNIAEMHDEIYKLD